MRRHIRMQQSANRIISALSIRDRYNTLNYNTHLISFSSRSASHPSPSSPSGPYGVGSVSSRTITGNSPCARTARCVSGAVSVDVGSATIDAWELGCTVAPDCAEPPCILVPGARVVAAGPEGMRRVLRRNAALRRTAISESESARTIISLDTHERVDRDTVPENASRSASHPPAPSNWVIAAALCFKRPESVYIALERSCLDDCAKGER